MYQYIRASLMGVILSEMCKKGKKKAPRVVALGSDTITEYNGKRKKTFKNINDALK